MSGNRYLMKLCPDELVHKFGSDMRSYHGVPASRCFVSEAKDKDKKDRKWTQLTAGSLNAITIKDRLLVMAHGDQDKICGTAETWNGRELAIAMKKWGLKTVGYIKFLSCDVGRGSFLDEFVAEAVGTQDIEVGFVQGYRGLAWPVLGPRKMLVATEDKHWLKTGDKRVKRVLGTFKQNAPQINVIDTAESHD
jgi:hypothetical protein